MKDILDIQNLNVDFVINQKEYPAIEDVSLKIRPQQSVGLVGESGSGKSLIAKTILNILPKNTVVQSDKFTFSGASMKDFTDKDYQHIRGNELTMISQNPMSSLNPIQKVGQQVSEVLEIHTDLSRKEIKEQVFELFKQVKFHNPQQVYDSYPHELSGGMAQRIVICMAIIAEPKLLIADEPTTALDTTVQKEILDIIRTLTSAKDNALLMITHDWGIISQMCDYVYVIYAGRILEEGYTKEVIQNPKHPYTASLLRAVPSIKKRGQKLYNIPFIVPGITERQRGNWPYIEVKPENRELVSAIFPGTL